MSILISFGQVHVHRVNGHTLDCDSLALVDNREQAFELFGPVFAFDYPLEKKDDADFMRFFPRGIIDVNKPGE